MSDHIGTRMTWNWMSAVLDGTISIGELENEVSSLAPHLLYMITVLSGLV